MMPSETLASKPLPGLGLSWRISTQHVEEIFLVHAADALQGGEIAACQQLEIADERFHRRIIAILLTKLDCKTFRQIAGKNARRIKGLQ